MSRLRIQHRTTYVYTRPVRFGSHRLVLHPREGHDLPVLNMTLTIAPAQLKHVPIGVSHHPRGVMPVSGTFDGTRQDFLQMNVQVQTDDLPV